MKVVDINEIVKFKNKRMTVAELGQKVGAKNEEGCIKAVNILIAKKHAFIEEKEDPNKKLLEDLINEDEILRIADEIELEEEEAVKARRREELEEVDSLKIALTFDTTLEAQCAEDKINDMGIDDTSIVVKKGKITLVVEDITPQEYTKIARMYSADKTAKTIVNGVSKGAESLTDVVNYGAVNVIAPTAKIVGEVGMNLGKGIFQTLAKTGAGLVNAGTKAVRNTAVEFSTDSEILKARAELRAGTNSVKNRVRGYKNKRRRASGIEVL